MLHTSKAMKRCFLLLFPALLQLQEAGAQSFSFPVRDVNNLMPAQSISTTPANNILYVENDARATQLNDATFGSKVKYKSNLTMVRLNINHAALNIPASSYAMKMVYQLEGSTALNSATHDFIVIDTLVLGFNPDSLTAYQDGQVRIYTGLYEAKLTILQFYEVSGTSPQLLPLTDVQQRNFSVELAMQYQPYLKTHYVPASMGLSVNPTVFNTPKSQLKISWAPSTTPFIGKVTPVQYELEWTYCDDYKADGSAITAAQVPFNFKNNATRITTDSLSYSIPVVYPRGYLVYRVRMVRPDSSLYKYPIYGPWSLSSASGNVGALNSDNYYQTGAHMGDALNWNYSIQFAEGGKYKHVMSYYDGMLKNRQTITRFNSRDTQLLVTENIYDYEGRPSITTLPSVVNTPAFKYQDSVSMSSVTLHPYAAVDFDKRVVACPDNALVPPFTEVSRANRYYSPLNTDTMGAQKFVPRANGYPFVHTQLSPGFSDRVDKQGGAGDTLQVNRGHHVANEYANADQTGLNQFFGLNSGFANYYNKTVSKDQNGQFSMSVKDFRGKVVMTSLVGASVDTSTHAIRFNDEVPDSAKYKEDKLAYAQQLVVGHQKKWGGNVYMDVPSLINVEYDYSFAPYQVCASPYLGLSVSGSYDYTLHDACGVEKLHRSGMLGTTGVVTSPQAASASSSDMVSVEKGNHTLNKTLTIATDEIYAAVDSFFAHKPNCARTEDDFIKEEVEKTKFPCPPADDPCEALAKDMMRQLFPKAKYGRFSTGTGAIVGVTPSIFDVMRDGGDAGNDGNYRYQAPCTAPALANVSVTLDNHVYTNLGALPVDTFEHVYEYLPESEQFRIARALLPLHPEYCRLQGCFPDTFATRLNSFPDAKSAVKYGYFSLNDIVAKDVQLTSKLIAAPFNLTHIEDSLKTMFSGLVRMDTMVAEVAFCSTDDAVAYGDAKQIFHNDIVTLNFPDDEIKNSYFSKLREVYLSNRSRWLAVAQSGGSNCGPCDTGNYRMTLLPPPLAPLVYNNAGGFATGPGTLMSILTPNQQASLNWYSQAGSGVNNNPATITIFQDSANNAAAAANNMLNAAAIDSIVSRLGNCYSGTAQQNSLKAALQALVTSGEVKNGIFLPGQVRGAILTAGLSLSDLCHPYLVSYDYYFPGADPQPSCKGGDFYAGMTAFFNDATIKGMLMAIPANGTEVSASPLYNTGNPFAQLMESALPAGGSGRFSVNGSYRAGDKTYHLACYRAGIGTGDSLVMSLSAKQALTVAGTARALFEPLTGTAINFENVSCYFEDPMASADGHIGRFMFRAAVTRTDVVGGTTYTNKRAVSGWNNGRIAMSETGANELAACVPCTQFKTIFKDFKDTMLAYGGYSGDHPLFFEALKSFANYSVKRVYSADQYERFLKSCALADSMAIPAYGGYGRITFNSSNGFTAFKTAADAALGISLKAALRYYPQPSGNETVYIDYASIPRARIAAFNSIMSSYGSVVIKGAATSGTGKLWLPSPLPAGVSIATLTAGTGFTYGAPAAVTVTRNTSTYTYQQYSLTAGSAAYGDVSRGVAGVQNALYSQGVQGYWLAADYATVMEDYYKPEKQQYLAYTYSAQGSSTPRVLDTVQDYRVQGAVMAFAGTDVSYADPQSPGRFTNLYYTAPANVYPGWAKLGSILGLVQTALGSNHLFPNGAPDSTVFGNAPPGTSLKLFFCADSLYWYRFFDADLKLYNVYLRVPAWVYQGTHGSFQLLGLRKATGDTATRRFTALLQSTAFPNDTIYASGSTTFDIAWSSKLSDVLLGNETPGTNTDALSGEVGAVNNCEQDALYQARLAGIVRYDRYIDSFRTALRYAFYDHVMSQIDENLWIEYVDKRFAYTLYHYDLAGNLIRTVPPAGVLPLGVSATATVNALRGANGYAATAIPQHKKVSAYEYSTVNKPLREITPDGGLKNMYYDAKGNVILSQNDRQRKNGLFTYSLYDGQNRVIETGEVAWMDCPLFADKPLYTKVNGVWVKTASPSPCACENLTDSLWTYCMPAAITNRYDNGVFDSTVRTKARTQVVATVYDGEWADLSAINGLSRQQNLRSRVAANMYYENVAAGAPGANYNHATHYSYDAAGNVNTLVQDFPELEGVKQRYKRVDYEYDLHSGKVDMLAYNRGYADQLYQRYGYDADNRITRVETSHDGFVWKRDAEYTYYQHGPLARASIGDQRVQGIDYAYTLQGWLKSINGAAIDSTIDMGGDGQPLATITPKDAFATEINYFNGDYSPIGQSGFSKVPAHTKNLYNGNIARQTTDIANLGALTTAYTYDQMNRIRAARYAKLAAGVLAFNDWYASAYKYDLDGNLQMLTRRTGPTGTGGTGPSQLMDTLVYKYPNGTTNNRLTDVMDYAAFNGTGYEDLKNYTNASPAVARFTYDETGNLIKDKTSGTDTIGWNIYGKTVDMANNTQKWTMHLGYDGAGQRVSKAMAYTTDTGRYERNTYYVRDATGNILAEYEVKRSWDTGSTRIRLVTDLHTASGLSNADWIDLCAGFGDDPALREYVTSIGGDTAVFPAGRYMLTDAALTAGFLQSGRGMLRALCRYSLSHSDYPAADALLLDIGDSDPNHRLAAVCNMVFTDPDTAARRRAIVNVCTAMPGLYGALSHATGYGLSGSAADSAAFYGAVDGIQAAQPDYLTSAVLGAWNGNADSVRAWLRVVTTDSSYLADGNDWYASFNYAGGLQGSLSAYGGAAAQAQAGALNVSYPFAGVYAFASWWAGGQAYVHSTYSAAQLRRVIYDASPGQYLLNLIQGHPMACLDTALAVSGVSYGDIADWAGVDLMDVARLGGRTSPSLRWQKVGLASHHLYGSSRLGIDGYWPKQYDATWDYGNGITDTIRLLGRVPWYSGSMNGAMNAGTANLWTTNSANITYYNGLSGAALASHVLGQVQYELSNHLGNVQATVSDKRYVKTTPGAANSGPGLSYNTRVGFAASLPAVYDYYPFGQPIKERTVRDTATQTTYMTQLVQVPNVANNSSVPNQNGLLLNAHNASLVPGGSGSVWVYGQAGTWGKNITGLTPNSAVSMSVSVGYVALAPVTISVSETVNGITTTLASVSGNSAASYLLSFTPTGSQVQVSVGLNHSLGSAGNLLSVTALNYSQQSGSVNVPMLVAVSSRGDDKYEFGFNGKYKDNEVSGIGNHYNFPHRDYDPRLGRWWSIDPLAAKYPDLSPYNFVANNPISHIDIDGRDFVYFNLDGKELGRIKSNTEFRTYIQVRPFSPSAIGKLFSLFQEVPMPKIITAKDDGHGNMSPTTSSQYQRFDYVIAAEVGIFNFKKKAGELPANTNGTRADPKTVSNLNPTLVKATIMQETGMGQNVGLRWKNSAGDVMQANVCRSAADNGNSKVCDWDDGKADFGLKLGESATPQQSIHAGIGLMYRKGLSSPDGKTSTFTSWENASKKYNGGGAANYGNVIKMTMSATSPTPANYTGK